MTGLHEECGVFGVYTPQTTDVAAMTYAALYALQHRGQESCGIVVNDRGVFSHHKDLGLVPEVFKAEDMEKLGHGNISFAILLPENQIVPMHSPLWYGMSKDRCRLHTTEI